MFETTETPEPTTEIQDDTPELQEQVTAEPGDVATDTETDPETDPDDRLSKARKDAATYRTRLREAVTGAHALRDQLIENYLGDGNVTTSAIEAAGVELGSLLSDDGRVDPEKVQAAAETTRQNFGIPAPSRFQGSADQGAAGRNAATTKAPGWSDMLQKAREG